MPRPQRARNPPPKSNIVAETITNLPSSGRDAEEQLDRGRSRRTRSTVTRLSTTEDEAIRRASEARDKALEQLAIEDITTSSIALGTGEDIQDSIEIGRHVAETPARRRDTTGLDLGDSIFGDLDDSFEDGDLPRGLGSVDNSSLNMSGFKPRSRSRQSSIISRNDPPIRPSSRGPNTPGVSSSFNIGLFRRRAREPSILGTSRKARQVDENIRQGGGHESEIESEADFAPEAESNPLEKRRSARGGAENSSRDTSPRNSGKAVARASRKRKSDEVHQNSERDTKQARLSPKEVLDAESDSELSSLGSPNLMPPAHMERPMTPITLDEINAAVDSSDSEDHEADWPDVHLLGKSRQRRLSVTTPTRVDDLSDMSSPPSLTHSPNYEEAHADRGRPAARRQKSPNITTADLTSLLPKRKYRKVRDSFGIDSDDENEDSTLDVNEEEISYIDSAADRRRRGSRPPSRTGLARTASRGARSKQPAINPKQPSSSTAALRQKAKQTYTRRLSDKENEGIGSDADEEAAEGHDNVSQALPDDTFDERLEGTSDMPSADELKKAAKKFSEVDKWELNFEEAIGSSSPIGAR